VEPLINTVRGWRTWWDEQDILAEAVRKRYKQFLFQRCKELLRLIPDKIFAVSMPQVLTAAVTCLMHNVCCDTCACAYVARSDL
jgi:hypothetical protein